MIDTRPGWSCLLIGVSVLAMATPAIAQETDDDSDGIFQPADEPLSERELESDTIIVSARRREETVQDVPAVVNPVTREQIERFNLINVQDIQAVVPGLQLSNNANGIGGNASIRGVNFDINASGNNPTVEFYFNDAPITAGAVLGPNFDIGQIEVVRGPQGTLKGRASPSGAINFIPARPDTLFFNGYVNTTATNQGGYNVNAAVNVPLITDVLAVRVAGVWDENEFNQVRTINTALGDEEPEFETTGARISVAFTPTDIFDVLATYQRNESDELFFTQYESLSEAQPGAATGDVLLRAGDRRSIEESPRQNNKEFEIFNLRSELSLFGQNLIYVGQHYTQDVESFEPSDNANFFEGYEYGQQTFLDGAESTSHEIRLQNETRLFDRFNYVIGALFAENESPTNLTLQTPVALFGNPVSLVETPVERLGSNEETSVFGSLTWFVTDKLEVTGGLRYIENTQNSGLVVAGNTVVDEVFDEDATIYSASATYDFNDNMTGYVSYGTSWRPGIFAIGNFSLNQSERERSFLQLEPEESESFEIGFKSKLFDRKVSLNVAAYRQEFDNFPYRSQSGVFFVNYAFQGFDPNTGAPLILPEVDQFNFVAAVPVEVYGIEADLFYRPNDQLTIGSTLAYADGEIQDGVIPCNDLDGDGIPDENPAAPTVGELIAAVGSDNVAACTVSQNSAFAAPFQGTIFAEYQQPLTSRIDGFARSLFSFDGPADGDPTNRFDDVDAYGLFDVFAGLRDSGGQWELSLFVKNLFDEDVVLTRSDSPATTGFQALQPPTFTTTAAENFNADYRSITMTRPREVGINFRYNFGTRQ